MAHMNGRNDTMAGFCVVSGQTSAMSGSVEHCLIIKKKKRYGIVDTLFDS